MRMETKMHESGAVNQSAVQATSCEKEQNEQRGQRTKKLTGVSWKPERARNYHTAKTTKGKKNEESFTIEGMTTHE